MRALPGSKDAGVVLAAESHVHSEWSWDAPDGSMERTCARAVNLGLPAIAFTEHVDYATWAATASDFDERLQGLIRPDGTLSPPELDLSGYLECVQRCRDRFRELEVFTGVELGEPHRHSDAVATSCSTPDSSTGCWAPCIACLWASSCPNNLTCFGRNQRPRSFGNTWPKYRN